MSDSKKIYWWIPVTACVIWVAVLYFISPDRSLERAFVALVWVIYGGLLVAAITAFACEVNQ